MADSLPLTDQHRTIMARLYISLIQAGQVMEHSEASGVFDRHRYDRMQDLLEEVVATAQNLSYVMRAGRMKR